MQSSPCYRIHIAGGEYYDRPRRRQNGALRAGVSGALCDGHLAHCLGASDGNHLHIASRADSRRLARPLRPREAHAGRWAPALVRVGASRLDSRSEARRARSLSVISEALRGRLERWPMTKKLVCALVATAFLATPAFAQTTPAPAPAAPSAAPETPAAPAKPAVKKKKAKAPAKKPKPKPKAPAAEQPSDTEQD